MKNILTIWTIFITIVLLDTYFEIYFGKNILGFGGEEFEKRIVSFFKDEPIVGGYINAFYLLIIGYLFFRFKDQAKKYQVIILIFSLVFVLAILLTGERSNTLKAIFAMIIFYFLFNNFTIKQKLISFLATLVLLIATVLSSDYLKVRYFTQIFSPNLFVDGKIDLKKNILTQNILVQHQKNIYFIIYKSGINIFSDNPIFGVGNKNYRLDACKIYDKKDKNYIKKFLCTTHPHQTYVEFLSEHGLVGTMILIFIFYNLIFKQLINISRSGNYIQLGCIAYLITIFVPILPSGAFFGDYNSTLFWINLSIMYAANPKTNIFEIYRFK